VRMTRWLYNKQGEDTGPLPIVAPQGPTARFVRRMLGPFDEDIAARMAHVEATPPRFDLTTFPVRPEPKHVWQSTDGAVTVDAVQVHHEPVTGAVAYRVATPDATVVISGDTISATRSPTWRPAPTSWSTKPAAPPPWPARSSARRSRPSSATTPTPSPSAGWQKGRRAPSRHHPPDPAPADPASAALFEADVRSGGYSGEVTVGQDLTRIVVGAT
jgi:ribonuclease Z